jgi:hypothetical protein
MVGDGGAVERQGDFTGREEGYLFLDGLYFLELLCGDGITVDVKRCFPREGFVVCVVLVSKDMFEGESRVEHFEGVEDLHFQVCFRVQISSRFHVFGRVRGLDALEEPGVVAEEEEASYAVEVPEGCEMVQKSEDSEHAISLRSERSRISTIGLTSDVGKDRVVRCEGGSV